MRDTSILLVGQTDYLAERVGEALRSSGYETLQVRSASQCLDRLGTADVDCVACGQSLPDLDGVRLIRSIRVTHPNLPIVMVPLDGSEELASSAIEAGVTRYIPRDDVQTVVSQIEESLHQSSPWADEESAIRYHHLLEVSPVPINLFDGTGESIWCNQAVLDLLGLDSRDELIGESIFRFIHPDDHELAEREIQQVTGDRESVGPTEMKLRRADGELRHVYVSTAIGRFLGDDIGQAIVIDITPLRNVERELREEQRFIETALDALPDVFYVIDDRGKLERWNAAAAEITGYGNHELEGRYILDFFAADDRSEIDASIERAFETGQDTVEARIVDDEGRRIPYQFRGRRLATEAETDGTRLVGIGRNISEQKARERQLEVLERWLRHNIRNDLNIIKGNAELILDDPDTDPTESAQRIHERAEHLIEQADRERSVVDLITDPPSPVERNLRGVVADLVEASRDRNPEAKIELASEDECVVYAIPALEDAVAELIENAIEHNDAETTSVTIRLSCGEDYGTVGVADNGPGIPEMDQAELFVDEEMDQVYHGTGLGLFFTHWVVRISGGTMEISANSPRGAVVELSFPLAAAVGA